MKLLTIIAAALVAVAVGCGSEQTAETPTPTQRAAEPTIPVTVPPAPDQSPSSVPTPDFTLPAADGSTVKLSDYRGKQPLVIVFYRGKF